MNCRFIELTQKLSAEAPTWNGSCGFCLEVKQDYDRVFRVHQIKMHAGVGRTWMRLAIGLWGALRLAIFL